MKKAKKLVALMLALVMAMGCMVTAFATDLTEDEATNDTAVNATEFDKEDTIKGVLDSATDVDYYSFNIDAMGLVTLSIEHNKLDSDSTYFDVSIEKVASPANTAITNFSSKGTDVKTSSASFGADKGEYLVKVSMGAAHDADLEYTLSYSVANVAYCEVEGNDTVETATAMQYASDLVVANAKKYYATISTDTDTDYFKMEVPAEGIVYFFVENDDNLKGAYTVSLETHTKVNGSPVEKTLGAIEIAKTDSLKNSACVGVAKGSYYFKVNAADTNSAGGYKLFATFIPFSGVEHEYNGDIMNANMISVGDTLQGSIFNAEDADCYKIITNQNNATFTVKAAASAGTGEGKWKVRVLNAAGVDVAGVSFNFTNETGNSYQFTEDIPAGTYYIVVEGTGTINSGLYTLSIIDDEEPQGVLGLIDALKAVDWSTFLANFTGWFGDINILGMVTKITESIIKLLARL